MRQLWCVLLACGLATGVNAQQTLAKNEFRKKPSLSVNFGMVDFQSAMNIRKDGVSGNQIGNMASMDEMDALISVGFVNGISNYFDYAVSYNLSSVHYPYRDKENVGSSKDILHEVDGSIRMKLLPDNSLLSPYATGGVGFSVYKGYLDAFMPVGGGLQLRLGEGIFANALMQYRVPVTARANYHFTYGIGIIASVGKTN